jgi:ParB/RepB/Spo0J family partition protein
VSEGFELLAGERSWRAAKIAGLKTVPVRIVDVTDEEACEIQARENFDREDLNPIERARQFQHLLDTLKITQDALAKRYDLSQGEISNSIRLLKLPDVAQKAVISGEITATEARDALVPFADLPDVVEKALRSRDHNLAYAVSRAAEAVSRDMNDSTWTEKPRLFKPTAQQRKQLDLRKTWNGQRAFNVELFDRLQAEAAAKASKRAEKKEASDDRAAQKETPERRREKAKAQAEQFARRLYRWKTAWLQGLVAERIVKADELLILRLLLHFCVAEGDRDRGEGLRTAIKTHVGKSPRGESWMRVDFWPSLQKLAGDLPWKVARSAVLAWVQDDFEGWHCHIDPEQIEDLARELGVEIKREWKLTREFLELHNKAQLVKLIEEWNVVALSMASQECEKRGELIDCVLRHPALKCPSELLKTKAVRLG